MTAPEAARGVSAQQALDVAIEHFAGMAQDTFDAGVIHGDEYGTYSATEREAEEFEAVAEALRDLRTEVFGDDDTDG